jgi:hypothetical protein
VSDKLRRRALRFMLAALSVTSMIWGAHYAVQRAAQLEPPRVSTPAGEPALIDGVMRFGESYVRRHGSILQVGLAGTPAQIGFSHSRLLYARMVDNEGALLQRFQAQVPAAPVRALLLDLAQLRYRHVHREMSDARLREIAAGALGFQPDPYAGLFPTFQRFVYLNALYDISLSFEGSPLLGCTSFSFSGPGADDGAGLLARAFDFEVDPIFDRDKAVFLVREQGKIPFASVAWPGLVGVVSGMNAEGLALVVHGGRAGEPRTHGEPVVHALRRVLSEARDADQAVRLLGEREPMVSHIVVLSDARKALVVERAPGTPGAVRTLPPRAAVTNHFESKLREDRRNQRVLESTSTRARRKRADELLAAAEMASAAAGPELALRLLRDRNGAGGARLELGDRRAIDALIATHGVIMESGSKTLWVSESPHLLGRFVAFELEQLLASDYDPARSLPLRSLPADPLLQSREYADFQRRQQR